MLVINIIGSRESGARKNPVPFILTACIILLAQTYLSVRSTDTGFGVFTEFLQNTKNFFNDDPELVLGGGFFGTLLYGIASMMFGRAGVIITMLVMLIVVMLFVISLDVYKNAFNKIVDFFRVPEDMRPRKKEEDEERENPNLWTMVEKSRQKRMFGTISADGEKPEDEPETARPGPNPFENTPAQRFGITIDDDTNTYSSFDEQIPVQQIEAPEKNNLFFTVDDLIDRTAVLPVIKEEEIPAVPEPEYEEPVILSEPEHEPETELPAVPAEKPAVKQEKKRYPKVYTLPKTTLLDPLPPRSANLENETAAKEKGELLISILSNFGIEAKLLDTHIGPSVTQFEIRPDASVKVSRISNLTDTLKMQLAASDIRVEAPIPGRNAVGVEIPNVKSTPVKMKELISTIPEKEKNEKLLFVVGKDLLGRTITCRLNRMPHLLIAGATGSGKSVCMNSIITSFLLRTDPKEVKLLLIDPKKVEFTPYHRIPHLIGPVINDANQANNALKVIARIMDERYTMFSKSGVRNIEVFNEKVREQDGKPNPDGSPCPKLLPYIVVIIDELADLMAVAGKEVELSIQRITQLARAAGIHLIVATQRPSVDVITGLIKSNIPSRIAFAVSSGTDSRTILDHTGAERLLGNGDMLYMPMGQNSPSRVQGVFVTDDEVRRITEDVCSKAAPMYDDSFVLLDNIDGGDGAGGMNAEDPLYEEVKEYVIEAQKASTSLLQRRFGIGYNRAARMIDILEQSGIIGPAQGSKPREVLVKND
ncbi:MAG: DNA translocase FtsK [Solobacterium sp.]|nr:DNA translocase FtsK [Solobacterium sp.]